MIARVNDIYDRLKIDNNQLNVLGVKSLLAAMKSKGYCEVQKQDLIFDDDFFMKYWNIYLKSLNFFDPNYNRKTDISSYFKRMMDSIEENKEINFHALFCPGYSKHGYKNYLGNTTTWKLKKIFELKNMLLENKINNRVICYYSDVFLENCDESKEKNWKEQLNYNRLLFHQEGEKYFCKDDVKNVSDISVFSGDNCTLGFIDKNIINSISKNSYSAFIKGNKKFYTSMGFTDEQIQFRNDRLITMYRIFSDYLNSLDESIFLPMENMYERENIFSENGTCTMYLKLK